MDEKGSSEKARLDIEKSVAKFAEIDVKLLLCHSTPLRVSDPLVLGTRLRSSCDLDVYDWSRVFSVSGHFERERVGTSCIAYYSVQGYIKYLPEGTDGGCKQRSKIRYLVRKRMSWKGNLVC